MKKKIKKIIITSAFILLISTSTTFIINDINSAKFTKAITDDNENEKTTELSITAHRGFSSLAIENSIKAIELGFENCDIESVEIDIHLTSDQKIIVHHDNKINDLKICEYDLETLKQEIITSPNLSTQDYVISLFDNISGNLIRERSSLLQKQKTTPPTLTEVLNIHKNYPDKTLIIELKGEENNQSQLIESTYNTIKNHDNQNIIIQSNNEKTLREMKEKYPTYQYHLIINEENYDLIHKFEFDGYAIRKNLIKYEDIKLLIDKNIKVSVWTINNYNDFEEIYTKAQDLNNQITYITNYPDAIKTWETITKPKVKVKKN